VEKLVEQEKALNEEFMKQSRIKALAFEIDIEIEAVKKNDLDPLTEEDVKNIIAKQENPDLFVIIDEN
jgi:hypothetical protein